MSEEDEVWSLTEDGMVKALQAYQLYKGGLGHEDIAAILGFADYPGDPVEGVRILITMASEIGLIDKFEEELENRGLKNIDEELKDLNG